MQLQVRKGKQERPRKQPKGGKESNKGLQCSYKAGKGSNRGLESDCSYRVGKKAVNRLE
jgi:hypothetical protein